MNDDARVLNRSGWFARQSPALRAAVLARARIAQLDAGQWIYGTGDALNGLYGVLEGSVHLLLTLPTARRGCSTSSRAANCSGRRHALAADRAL